MRRTACAAFIRRPTACALLVLLALLSSGVAKADEDAVTTFENLKPSLAIVQSEAGGAVAMGTAFCIASDSTRSYFLTNDHVLIGDKVRLRLQLDHSTYAARILRRAVPPMDAAIIEIDRGNIPAVALANDLPKPGTLIAVAGYPSFHLTSDLEPSIHLGAINSIMEEGEILEHDALTDHGNSGGPLFDRDTGVVYGINSALVPSRTSKAIVNFIAFAMPYIIPFLDNAKIVYARAGQGEPVPHSSESSAILAETPAAFRVGYLAPDAQQAGAVPVKVSVDNHITTELGNMLGSQLISVPLAGIDTTRIGAAVSHLCRTQNVNAIVFVNYTWTAQVKGSADHLAADVQMLLLDCHMQLIVSGKNHKESDFPIFTTPDVATMDYASTVTSAADAIFAEWRSAMAKNPTAIVNLARYGFAIGTGQRTTGVTLGAGKDGAVVTSIASVGTGETAGLRRFDIITMLNGESLAGLSQEQLNAAIAKAEASGGKYNVEVLRADGKSVDVQYESEDIRWYLKQPTISITERGSTMSGVQTAAFVQSVGGSYAGPVRDLSAGNGKLQLSLIESHGTLSGTWGIAFEKNILSSSGTLWGSVSGSRMTATLKPVVGGAPCIVMLIGTLAKDGISGTYRSDSCAIQVNGTFQVHEQSASVVNIAGAYGGTLADNVAGTGTFTVTISQNGTSLSGTWAVSFSDRRLNNSGTITGVLVNATTAQLYLNPSVAGGCVYSATAVVDGRQMKGTYATQNCGIANGGSFTAAR